MKISKKKKKSFFSHVPRITRPKNYVPRSKGVLCSSRADRQTHIQTDTKVKGHPFMVSGIFPSTCHQGSVQNTDIFFYPTRGAEPSHQYIIQDCSLQFIIKDRLNYLKILFAKIDF